MVDDGWLDKLMNQWFNKEGFMWERKRAIFSRDVRLINDYSIFCHSPLKSRKIQFVYSKHSFLFDRRTTKLYPGS